eukprot:jgi/Mesvir1/27275/Mv07110-RA.1
MAATACALVLALVLAIGHGAAEPTFPPGAQVPRAGDAIAEKLWPEGCQLWVPDMERLQLAPYPSPKSMPNNGGQAAYLPLHNYGGEFRAVTTPPPPKKSKQAGPAGEPAKYTYVFKEQWDGLDLGFGGLLLGRRWAVDLWFQYTASSRKEPTIFAGGFKGGKHNVYVLGFTGFQEKLLMHVFRGKTWELNVTGPDVPLPVSQAESDGVLGGSSFSISGSGSSRKGGAGGRAAGLDGKQQGGQGAGASYNIARLQRDDTWHRLTIVQTGPSEQRYFVNGSLVAESQVPLAAWRRISSVGNSGFLMKRHGSSLFNLRFCVTAPLTEQLSEEKSAANEDGDADYLVQLMSRKAVSSQGNRGGSNRGAQIRDQGGAGRDGGQWFQALVGGGRQSTRKSNVPGRSGSSSGPGPGSVILVGNSAKLISGVTGGRKAAGGLKGGVGRQPGAGPAGRGKVIDGYGAVVRFNAITSVGTVAYVGTKVTHDVIGDMTQMCGCSDGACCNQDQIAQFLKRYRSQRQRTGAPAKGLAASTNTNDPANKVFVLYARHGKPPTWMLDAAAEPDAPFAVQSLPVDRKLSGAMNLWLDMQSKHAPGLSQHLRHRLPTYYVARTGFRLLALLLFQGVTPTLTGFDLGEESNELFTGERKHAGNRGAMKYLPETRVLQDLVAAGLVQSLA